MAMHPEIGKDMELRIRGHLHEIREINDEVLESRQGYPKAEEGYQKSLFSAATCADMAVVDEVAERIKEEFRRTGNRPTNRKIRRNARAMVSEAGYPTDQYLNTV